jgi:hypothetical protein
VEDISVFGLLGYLTAVVMGWKLLRAIRRSDDGKGSS